VTQGLTTPGEQIPYLMQGGLGMPEREYYLVGDPTWRARDQVSRLCRNDHEGRRQSRSAGAADRIIALETKIAQAHATREESEDFAKGAKVWTRAELEKNAPGIDWGALLDAAAARQRAEVPGLSSTAIPEAGRAGRVGAARRVEGLAGVPHAQPAGRRAAQAVPRRQLRLQRHRAGGATEQRPRERWR
jgi:hypothetical protein